LIMGD